MWLSLWLLAALALTIGAALGRVQLWAAVLVLIIGVLLAHGGSVGWLR